MRVFCQSVWRAYEKRLLTPTFSDLVLDDLFVALPFLLVSEYKGSSDSMLRLYRWFSAPYDGAPQIMLRKIFLLFRTLNRGLRYTPNTREITQWGVCWKIYLEEREADEIKRPILW